MDPQTIEMLKVVLPDAIKILGPALITGVVAYLTIRVQHKTKLEEVFGNQGFKAREHLLDYYKKKITDAGDAANALNSHLGYILGSTTAVGLYNQSSVETYEVDDVNPQIGMVDMYLELCEFEIQTTLRDMESVDLNNTQEHKKLNDYLELSKTLTSSKEDGDIKRTILKLAEIYTFIARCSQFVLEAQIEKLFGSYVK